MKNTFLIIAALFFMSQLGYGQIPLTENTLKLEEGQPSPLAKVADMAWLTGTWQGKGFGGMLEEIWSAPQAGSMVATFKMMQNGQTNFYEICLLAEENGTLVYKVKHFNPDLTAWEEKDKYITSKLVKLEENKAYFEGLTLIREGNTCTHYLAMGQKDGGHKEAKLVYTFQ